VIGSCGAGKSTFSKALAQKTGLPLVHLDKIHWYGNWQQLSREAFDSALEAELEKPCWIIDGNFNRTIPERIRYCDTVIYLDFSRFACLMGVLKRVVTTYGTVRPDMGEGCPERIDWDFLRWIWNFNKDKRERYYHMLNETEGIETIVLKNRRAVKKFLSQV
jgi:adenylate kinase family enzyme